MTSMHEDETHKLRFLINGKTNKNYNQRKNNGQIEANRFENLGTKWYTTSYKTDSLNNVIIV